MTTHEVIKKEIEKHLIKVAELTQTLSETKNIESVRKCNNCKTKNEHFSINGWCCALC